VSSHRTLTETADPGVRRGRRRPHVVIEDAELPAAHLTAASLRRAGFEVTICGGPDLLARRRCPLEEGTTCPAIADADVVVAHLGARTTRQAAVVAALRDHEAGLPLVVLAAPPVAHRHRRLLEGCRVVPPHQRGELVRVVDEVVGGDRERLAP
jgi:hypothetical protein